MGIMSYVRIIQQNYIFQSRTLIKNGNSRQTDIWGAGKKFWASIYYTIITSAKEVMFLPDFVCLFVC